MSGYNIKVITFFWNGTFRPRPSAGHWQLQPIGTFHPTALTRISVKVIDTPWIASSNQWTTLWMICTLIIQRLLYTLSDFDLYIMTLFVYIRFCVPLKNFSHNYYMETSPLPVRGCKISQCSGCYTYCDTGPRGFFLVSSKGQSHLVAFFDSLGDAEPLSWLISMVFEIFI
jgi:hypothetical protein